MQIFEFELLKQALPEGRYDSNGALVSLGGKKNSVGKKEIIHYNDCVLTVFSGNIDNATNQQTVVRYNNDGTMMSSSTKGSIYQGTYNATNNGVHFFVQGINDNNNLEYLSGNINNIDGAIEFATNAVNKSGKYRTFSSTEVMTLSPRLLSCTLNEVVRIQNVNADGNFRFVFRKDKVVNIDQIYSSSSDTDDLVHTNAPLEDVIFKSDENEDQTFYNTSGLITAEHDGEIYYGTFYLDNAIQEDSQNILLSVRTNIASATFTSLNGKDIRVQLGIIAAPSLALKITNRTAYRFPVWHPIAPQNSGVNQDEYMNKTTYKRFSKSLIDMNEYKLEVIRRI